jgi:carotenoid cleavage dioxygenase
VEFPKFNDSKNGSSYHYTYTPCNLTSEKNTDSFNAIVKYDLKTNSTTVHDFGLQYEIGEAVFVPRSNSHEEDDGYLMLFGTHRPDLQSDFFLLNAKDLAAEPIAQIRLPQRVPHGLHGSWMAGPW